MHVSRLLSLTTLFDRDDGDKGKNESVFRETLAVLVLMPSRHQLQELRDVHGAFTSLWGKLPETGGGPAVGDASGCTPEYADILCGRGSADN